ncbi:MAG: FeoB-associated Cys-rich membrane protein [Lachnospiraceae bacterium]|nr:FeoB-associated Cys-rich membrane protein [Candidatus Equihabitans merdae]
MANIIIVLLLLAIVGSAIAYMRKVKKRGKCVGCPYCGGCSKTCSGENKSCH